MGESQRTDLGNFVFSFSEPALKFFIHGRLRRAARWPAYLGHLQGGYSEALVNRASQNTLPANALFIRASEVPAQKRPIHWGFSGVPRTLQMTSLPALRHKKGSAHALPFCFCEICQSGWSVLASGRSV